MKAIVLVGGPMRDVAFYRPLFSGVELIVCADGGAKLARRLGVRPHVVVGDLDSLDEATRKWLQEGSCRFFPHPARKDETDTELALKYALTQGAEEIILLGALGSRLDHTLANILLLALPELAGRKAKIVDESQEIFLARDDAPEETVIEGQVGDLVSLLPLKGDAGGIYTEGLEYALQNGTLRFGLARGVSNVMTKPVARIRVKKGVLLAIHLTGVRRTS